ncbi:MAG: hypothetical protein K8J08_03680 [Thermoanaerobaculia bacterium]|nr:hypothetical protein [Thermoanaerobaculia bacterium]
MKTSRREYFQAIEELFIDLRGAPLLLSPADWQVAKKWHGEGIPLATVEEAVREIFARRDERRDGDRINSLRYCKSAVEKAWHDLQEIRGPGLHAQSQHAGGEGPGGSLMSSPQTSLSDRLLRLADSLPASLTDREIWQNRITELTGDVDAIEKELVRLDHRLLEELEGNLSDAERRRLCEEVERALDRVRSRLAVAELNALRNRLMRQRIRKELEVPMLSLIR